MGRELLYCISEEQKVLVATTHLESPTPPAFNEVERIKQLQHSLLWLDTKFINTSLDGSVTASASNAAATAMKIPKKNQDVILVGDLNWCENRGGKTPGDGRMPFPSSEWVDAWEVCNPNIQG